MAESLVQISREFVLLSVVFFVLTSNRVLSHPRCLLCFVDMSLALARKISSRTTHSNDVRFWWHLKIANRGIRPSADRFSNWCNDG